jgi:hypothetical protein
MKYIILVFLAAFLGLILYFIYQDRVDKGPIFYEYNGVTITRVDNGNKSYFYYGR